MKKLAIYAAAGCYGLYYFFGKGKQAYTAYKNLKTQIVAARNLKAGVSQFKMDVDILATNTGTTPIDINTGGLAKLKKVNLYSAKGMIIGQSTPVAIVLNIPAGGQQLITNVPTSINTNYVLEALGNINNVKNVTTTIDIEVAGQIITV